MQLSLTRVAEQRGGDLPPLQHVLHADQERGERFRRDGHVFEHGRRPARPLDAVEERLRLADQPPEQIGIVLVEGRARPAASRFCWKTSSTSRCVRWRTSTGSSPSYSTSSRASVSAGIKTSKRISPSRARLTWRRSIRSHAVGCVGRISPTARAALSRLSNSNRTTPRCRGRACVDNVASVIKTSVPSEPATSPARSSESSAEDVREVVAAAFQRALGLVLPDHVGAVAQERGQAVDQIALSRIGVFALAAEELRPIELHQPAVGQRDLKTLDVPPDRAVLQPAATAGVAGDHAADRGDGAGGRVGAEAASPRPQLGGQPLVRHSRLHPDRFPVDADDAAEEPGEVDHQSRAERFAGRAAAGSAGVNGDALLGGVLQAGRRVGRPPRPHHGQRLDLVNAGVGRVKLQRDFVATNLARDQSAQVVLDSLTLLMERVHEAASGGFRK